MMEKFGIVEYDPDNDKCVHKVAVDANDPSVQYIQHHTGVFRTRDFGETVEEISEGLPEQFGFPIVSHPHKSDHIWVIPNHSGEFRYSSTVAFRVFKSENGGDNWRPLTNGLPQENAYFSTLRESMAVDGSDPLGVYIGTKNGILSAPRTRANHGAPSLFPCPPYCRWKRRCCSVYRLADLI
jgi:hypothetical protein